MKKLLYIFALLTSSASWAGTFDCAEFFDAQKYAEDLRKARPLADTGNARDQFLQGLMYEFGQGVTKDEKVAIKWYRLSANQGDAEAQYRLGYMYGHKAEPVLLRIRDEQIAAKWYRLSADQGDARAQFHLGLLYEFESKYEVRSETVATDKWNDAVALFRMAADQGYPCAQSWLGFSMDVTMDEQERVKLLSRAADQGEVIAQRELARRFYRGEEGVAKNEQEGIRRYRMAAEQGDVSSQTLLGDLYSGGLGIAKDDQEAFKWYRMAAEQGDAAAQYILGSLYSDGRGVAKDERKAVMWFRMAADRGDADAQNALGARYLVGNGVLQDFAQAGKYFRLAASEGNEYAQLNLGYLYRNGYGVGENLIVAYAWFNLAAAAGHPTAVSARNYVAKDLTAKEIQQAQKLSAAWVPGQLIKEVKVKPRPKTKKSN